MSVETRTERQPAGGPPARPLARLARLRPKLGVADTLLQLWRAKWLMFLVFIPIALLGMAITLLAPTKFAASTRLLVRPGQEHVFDPVMGEAARGAMPQQEAVLQAEAELARSPVIAERVIADIGLSRLYPGLAEQKLRVSDNGAYQIDEEALEAFAQDFEVTSASKSFILRMTYAHQDPTLAAATLNRLVTEYLKYRQEVLQGQDVAGLTEQRRLIEERLLAADGAMRDFLARNGLSDFAAAKAAATRLFAVISDELAEVDASIGEAEAKSAGLRKQMAATPKDIDLYVETTSGQEMEKLHMQREELLTRYLPDSRAVQDIERKITRLEGFMASAPALGPRRIGPNPTWQALEADRAVQSASISALKGRSAALAQQKLATETQIKALAALEPEYLRLKRDRDALEASAGAFATRQQTEQARTELAARSADNISLYEAARPPTKGDGAKQIIAITAALFGLLAAVAAGLLRAWSVQSFPTAGAIERTLGLRVLAAARDRSQ